MVEVLKRLLAQHQPQVATSRTSAADDSYARMVKELGQQLHRTLDTVLAETMARDVIYKEYHPRLEGCEIGELLKGSMEHGDSPNTYALQLVPECMPRLHIDPQLILYIHSKSLLLELLLMDVEPEGMTRFASTILITYQRLLLFPQETLFQTLSNTACQTAPS